MRFLGKSCIGKTGLSSRNDRHTHGYRPLRIFMPTVMNMRTDRCAMTCKALSDRFMDLIEELRLVWCGIVSLKKADFLSCAHY